MFWGFINLKIFILCLEFVFCYFEEVYKSLIEKKIFFDLFFKKIVVFVFIMVGYLD